MGVQGRCAVNVFPQAEVQHPLRRYPRIPFSGRAVIFTKDTSCVSTSLQISQGGILVSTPMKLNVGDTVTVHCTILRCYLRLKGEVIYVIGNSANPERPKVGIRFNLISSLEKELIKTLVAEATKP